MTRVEQLKARIAERRASMSYDAALRREGAKPRPRKPDELRAKRKPKPPRPSQEQADAALEQALAAIGVISESSSRCRRSMLRRIEEAAFEAGIATRGPGRPRRRA